MANGRSIQIVFSPLPEERDVDKSAAKEFALRAEEKFRDASKSTDGDDCSSVEIHHLADWKKHILVSDPIEPTEKDDEDEVVNVSKSTVVFLISCGPDGSVHRSVRKTTKWIKEQGAKSSSTSTTAVVALLGHAVCKTSAEQMEDEVYSSGRRLAKSLEKIITAPPSSVPAPSFLLETQIELESPEEKFDGWISSWVNMLRQ